MEDGWTTDDETGTAPVVESDFFMSTETVEQLNVAFGPGRRDAVPRVTRSAVSWVGVLGLSLVLGAFFPKSDCIGCSPHSDAVLSRIPILFYLFHLFHRVLLAVPVTFRGPCSIRDEG